jgi:rod shape-determining protein MreD
MPRFAQAPELLLPVKGGFILFTILAGLTLNLLPLPELLVLLRPDFLLLVLLYWIVYHPMRVNIGAAWLMGLVVDVAYGNLLGQYALAYALTAFICLGLRRRVLMFPLWQQTLHILPLLLLTQTIVLLIKLSSGASWAGPTFYLSSAFGAVLWLWLPPLLQIPQRKQPNSDPQ